MSFKYETIDEVLDIAENAIGNTFRNYIIEEESFSEYSKGNLGHIIEKGLYGLDINNKRAPDFSNLGVELKVTGYKWVYKGTKVSAKERLVITMIDFFDNIEMDFYDTHLYEKIDKILLILYEYDDEKLNKDFLITNYYLYEFAKIPEKDKIIIIQDFKKIMEKIKAGKAHEISEGDTMYLGACTKGADSNSIVNQPYSAEKAMARAYSLKTTYMTNLLRNNVFNEVESKESLIKDLNLLRNYSFEDNIYQLFNPYKEKTLSEIDVMIGETLNRKGNKQLMRSYTSRMLKVTESNFNQIEEFEKANIEIKTISLEANGKLKEKISFPAMDFKKVANETWDDSELKDFFESTKFLFVIFQKVRNSENNERIFKGTFLWNMPTTVIETYVSKVWNDMNNVLNNSIRIKVKNNRVFNNFPKISENKVSHVRPHGNTRETTKPLPERTKIEILENDGSVDLSIFFDEHKYSAMCFWINSSYILELIAEANLLGEPKS